MLYLIEILHQTTTLLDDICYVRELYLIEILHQTTTRPSHNLLLRRCILSKFYIKPQLRRKIYTAFKVVSYRNSTSNHNSPAAVLGSSGLYLIEILHQTTTMAGVATIPQRCILSKFYIKPQLSFGLIILMPGCILSKFYIKPQRR